MKGSHIHIKVKNLEEMISHLQDIWNLEPAFQNDRMSVVPFGSFSIIFDKADESTEATIAFDSQNCEKDFQMVKERGAEVIEEPTKQPWGVIAAYIKGPGKLTFEIEQVFGE